MIRRVLWNLAVLLLYTIYPAVALAQQSPAGVVTTLHGLATVARTPVPQEIPLKFKDDVFYKDRITTKESSIVRVLLGGKALVTVRELSVLTITEEPGRATVDLDAGKISLAVARKLMRPGESIEIRTPNAIAAVRGTVVVVEVIRATAAAQLSPAAWTTIVSAVSDAVNVSAAGVSRLVTAGFSTNVLGLQPPGVPYPSPPTIFQGLTAPPQFSQNADSGNEVGKAETLATALTGGLPVSPPLPALPRQQPPSTSNIGVQETAALRQVIPNLIQNGGLVQNGGFETGTFKGWQVFNQPGGSGDIFIFSGGSSPLSGYPVPAPPEGHFAAITDQTGPGVHILSQVITIPSTNPMLQFDYFIGNRAGVFVTPNSITLSSFNVSCSSCPDANQQARVDILSTAAGIQDVGGGVLRMLARTNPNSQAVSSGWNTLAFDLSAFAGQTVVLRFSEVDNLFFFQAGVDDVRLLGNLTVDKSLLRLSGDWLLTTSATEPHIRLVGETHAVATNPGAAIFDLSGGATAVDRATGLILGTDQPIRGPGLEGAFPIQQPLIETVGARVNTQQAVKLDTALLEATAPLLNFLAGSQVISTSDLVKVVQKANLTASLVPSDALVKLNASTLTVNSGSLFNVAGGSVLSVTGNLVSLTNGSALNILNGSLLTVSGGSVFKLTGGSLGVFGSGTNSLNITNTSPLCSGCSLTTSIPNFGYPVLLANGATAANVQASAGFTPFAGLSPSNTVKLGGASGAVLTVSGSTSKVILNP